MSKADLILEALFTGADDAECTRRDIIAPKIMQDEWMEEFLKRKDVTKLPDGSYDVHGNVDLDRMGWRKLPARFNIVHGYFWCEYNKLTSLEGAPKECRSSTNDAGFWCRNNQLTNLKGAPRIVEGHFGCDDNQITSLEGGPSSVSASYLCSNNNLTNLKGAPAKIGEHYEFDCSRNPLLTSLEGAPKEVGVWVSDHAGKDFSFDEIYAACPKIGATSDLPKKQ